MPRCVYIHSRTATPPYARMPQWLGAPGRALGAVAAWYERAHDNPYSGSSALTVWYKGRGRWTNDYDFAMGLAMKARADKGRKGVAISCIRVEPWVVSVLGAMYAIVAVFLLYDSLGVDVAIILCGSYALLALVLSNEVFINMGIPVPGGGPVRCTPLDARAAVI